MGEVKIADDAVEEIAAIAVTDIKGVKYLLGGITREKIASTEHKVLQKAVKVNLNDGKVQVMIAVVLDGTAPIPRVTEKIQSKVKDAIEMMTGYETETVNVEITGVEL